MTTDFASSMASAAAAAAGIYGAGGAYQTGTLGGYTAGWAPSYAPPPPPKTARELEEEARRRAEEEKILFPKKTEEDLPLEGETDWWNKYFGWLPFVEEETDPAVLGALPEGFYDSPFQIPPEVIANYNIEYDDDLMLWRVGDMKVPKAEVEGMAEFERQYAERQLELEERLVLLKEQEAKWKQEQEDTLTAWQVAQLKLERERAAQAQQEARWRQAQEGRLTEYQAAQVNLAQRQLQQEYTLATQAAPISGYQAEQVALQQQQLAWEQEQAVQAAARQSELDRLALEQQLWERGATEQEFQLAGQQFEAQQAQLAQQFGLTQEQWRWQQEQATQQFGLTQEQWLHEQEQARLAQEQQLWGRGITETQMEQQYGLQQQQLAQQLQLAQLPYQQMTAYQQAQTQQQQQAYAAQLAAQPRSWLEYSAFTGEQPAVQPWMQPLMPQQYSQLGAGQAIPGYTPTSMTEMPALTTPSRQYQARMGPTAQEQYLGYRQARTGARPEETEWRLWSQAPPGGRHTGLTYGR